MICSQISLADGAFASPIMIPTNKSQRHSYATGPAQFLTTSNFVAPRMQKMEDFNDIYEDYYLQSTDFGRPNPRNSVALTPDVTQRYLNDVQRAPDSYTLQDSLSPSFNYPLTSASDFGLDILSTSGSGILSMLAFL